MSMEKTMDDLLEEVARNRKAKKTTGEASPKKEAKPKVYSPFKSAPPKESTKGKISFTKLLSKLFKTPPPLDREYYFTIPEVDESVKKDIPTVDTNIVPDINTLLSVLLAIEHRKPMLLHGPTGSGKTTYNKLAAALLGYPYMRITGMAGVEVGDLIGQLEIEGGETVWEDGPLAYAVRNGYLLSDDEPFKNSAGVAMSKQWLLEQDDPYLLMVGNHHERTLKPHENFRLIMCDNVRGTGDGLENYAATNIQDGSTINRIAFTAFVDYLPPSQEQQVLTQRYDNFNEEHIRRAVQLGNAIRKAWKTGTVEVAFSLRNLTDWFDATLMYHNHKEAFALAYMNKLSEEEQGVVAGLWADVGFERW